MEYNQQDITKIRIKLNSNNYSDSWYKKHFTDMLNRIEKLNQKVADNEKQMEKSNQIK
jgi:hypothetical protein|tara:strand:- start:82 stop:255 length:174 start_codon:yes stop_codon:yes gene_type:complete